MSRIWLMCALLFAPLTVFADARYQAVPLHETGRAPAKAAA